MTVNAGINIITPYPEIERQLLNIMSKRINLALPSANNRAVRRVRKMFKEGLPRTEIATSLKGAGGPGSLMAHFGLLAPHQKIDAIANALADSFSVEFAPLKSGRGYVKLLFFSKDFREVLNIPEAHQINTHSSNPAAPPSIPWLSWLLESGDEVVVKNYRYYPNTHKKGRAGFGLMIRPGEWAVPRITAAAGNRYDNWLTRFLDSIDPQIRSTFGVSLMEALTAP